MLGKKSKTARKAATGEVGDSPLPHTAHEAIINIASGSRGHRVMLEFDLGTRSFISCFPSRLTSPLDSEDWMKSHETPKPKSKRKKRMSKSKNKSHDLSIPKDDASAAI
jgi:hypothetical protein